MLKGILGQIMGHSPSEQKAHLDAVTKEANDLSAFVKRKPASKKPPQKSETVPKRSAPEEGAGGDTKRARAGDNLE